MRFLTLALAVGCCFRASIAKSVLGVAVTGGTSHHATFAKIGVELSERGHDFTLLLSSGDTLAQARLAYPPFSDLKQIRYSGPEYIGTNEWLSDLDRDPAKARLGFSGIFVVHWQPMQRLSQAVFRLHFGAQPCIGLAKITPPPPLQSLPYVGDMEGRGLACVGLS